MSTNQGPGAPEDDVDGFFLSLHFFAQGVHITQQADVALHKYVLTVSIDFFALSRDAIKRSLGPSHNVDPRLARRASQLFERVLADAAGATDKDGDNALRQAASDAGI